jgi:hypothetical protein
MAEIRLRCLWGLVGLLGCSHLTQSDGGSTSGGTGTSATTTGEGTLGSAGSGGGSSSGSTGTEGGSSSGSSGTGVSGTTGAGGVSSASSGGLSGCGGVSMFGGPCATTANCQHGYVCTSESGGGTCVVNTGSYAAPCIAAGNACGGDAGTCCGVCVDGGCQDLANFPCQASVGGPCSSVACCNLLACVDGGCQPTCGQAYALCNPDHGNADCCVAQGYTCQATVDGGSVFWCSNQNLLLGAGCAALCIDGGLPQCELGSPCNPIVDQCVGAGLVCDPLYDVCTQPEENEQCLLGGPPCVAGNYFQNSSAEMVCAPDPATTQDTCTQLCQSTRDCIDPQTACCTSCVPPTCELDESADRCTVFYPCNSQGESDGVCLALREGPSSQLSYRCYQATVDGGGAGASCDNYATRQNPAFCDTSHFCVGGLCVALCNPGSDSGPDCPDRATQQCNDIYDQNSGYCLTRCDLFTDAGDPITDASCAAPDGGAPEVCVPIYWFLADDSPRGACTRQEAPSIPIGQRCTADTSGASPCAAGSWCFNDPYGGSFCDQICLLDGGSGCPSGQPCAPLEIVVGFQSSVTGVCLPDAGM